MRFSLESSRDLQDLIKKLSTGLKKLDIEENMETYKITGVDIPASSEKKIENKLKFIPTQYIITSQQGAGQVTKGDNAWTRNHLFLKNNGSSAVTITVLFLK
jgi:hypothetical protein